MQLCIIITRSTAFMETKDTPGFHADIAGRKAASEARIQGIYFRLLAGLP
jgi:hypothetical protein